MIQSARNDAVVCIIHHTFHRSGPLRVASKKDSEDPPMSRRSKKVIDQDTGKSEAEVASPVNDHIWE